MRNTSWLLSILILGGLSCTSPQGGSETTEAAPEATEVDEAAAVRKVAEAFDPAMNSKNLDAMMALYASDAVRLDPGRPPRIGREAIHEDFAGLFEGAGIEVSNPVDEVHVAGDWAFARGSYRDVLEGGSGEVGKWVSIFTKTPDGWKYAVDMWNRDAPSTTSPPAAGESPALPEPTVPEQLKSQLDAWDAAFQAGDVDALVAAYTPDGHRMSADEPAAVGRESIRASFENELATPPESAKATVHGVKLGGDWAYAWGTWAEARAGAKDRGKWLEVFKRTPDGWKIYIEIWNRGA